MPLQTDLVELERRHKALEKEIEQELRHRRDNDAKLHELKRKKLRLKDEIVRVRQGATLH